MSENKNKQTPGQAARAVFDKCHTLQMATRLPEQWDAIAQAAIDASCLEAELRKARLVELQECEIREQRLIGENKRLTERVRELEETVKYYVSEYGEWP